MRNQYAGTCYRCGLRVEHDDGHFERFAGRWRTQHAECAIKFRGVPDPAKEKYTEARDKRKAEGTGKAAQRARRRLRDRGLLPPITPLKEDVLYAANYWRKLAAANPANQPSHKPPPVPD